MPRTKKAVDVAPEVVHSQPLEAPTMHTQIFKRIEDSTPHIIRFQESRVFDRALDLSVTIIGRTAALVLSPTTTIPEASRNDFFWYAIEAAFASITKNPIADWKTRLDAVRVANPDGAANFLSDFLRTRKNTGSGKGSTGIKGFARNSDELRCLNVLNAAIGELTSDEGELKPVDVDFAVNWIRTHFASTDNPAMISAVDKLKAYDAQNNRHTKKFVSETKTASGAIIRGKNPSYGMIRVTKPAATTTPATPAHS